MTEMNLNSGDRLDSWKAIAHYLKRDVATVRRWETGLGLPVRRVAGSGRSVFAYRSEIDAWLQTRPAIIPSAPESRKELVSRRGLGWIPLAVAVGVAAVIGTAVFVPTSAWRRVPADLRLEVTSAGVVGRDPAGNELWRHVFPADPQTAIQSFGRNWLVAGGRRPAAYVARTYTFSRITQLGGSGELIEFSLDGALRRTFSFDDELTIEGQRYGPPWVVTTMAVDDSTGTRRIAVAGHHYTWHPSPVTILDEHWRRLGTFVHAGWVEALEWLGRDRLLIAGYSETRRGGMVGLLDAEHLGRRRPDVTDCDDCPAVQPVRMVVMPRSEVNLSSGWRFNRVLIERPGDRILARTIELEMDAGQADVVYEFSSSLELLSAAFSDRYWDAHRRLEAEGKLGHPRERCPDRDGPRTYDLWTASTGWRTVPLR